MKQKNVSLNDIAKSLGVSRALVSLVLNGKAAEHGIAESTCQRVLAKASELNYKPNQLARSLRLGRSFTIGLVVSDISNIFYSKLARAIEDLAERAGFSLVICSTDEQVDKEQKLLRLLQNRQVEGIILSSSQADCDDLTRLKNDGIPLVLIDRKLGCKQFSTVVSNNHLGGEIGTKHLIDSGYKRPLALAITPAHISTISERVKGYTDAVTEAGIAPWVAEVPFEEVPTYVESLIGRLKAENRLPDSIFALNNSVTSAALVALKKHGLDVPASVGLISFDDIPYFEFMNPAISAVEQPIAKLAEVAFGRLMDQINGSSATAYESLTVELPVNLIVRESTTKQQPN